MRDNFCICCVTHRAVLQENHSNSSTISQSSSNNTVIAETQHQVTKESQSSIINQTLQSININNNNNGNNKNKIHSNVDQQISSRDPSCKEDEDVDEEVLVEPNNNTNNNSSNINNNSNNTNNHQYSSSRASYRHHPVSRRGTEFISQQVPSFRTFGSGGGSNKHITPRKG